MNKLSVILIAVLMLAIIGGLLGFLRMQELNDQSEEANYERQVKIDELERKISTLTNDNNELTKQAFPKPFSTSREMVKWIDNNKSLASGSYYSIDAVKLLNRARNDGALK